jgi:predicted membrane channel-forming protein YqfA (hemolysin III family)
MMMMLIFVAGAAWFLFLTTKTEKKIEKSISFFLAGACTILGISTIWWWMPI